MEHLSLAAGGPERRRADWERAAAAVLRRSGRMGADDPDSLVWQTLARTTLDGVVVPPLGTAETIAELPGPGLPGQAPYTRGRLVTSPEDGWDVRAHLADPDADRSAADAVTDLENGASSLWLGLGQGGIAVTDLDTVLAGVHVDRAPVVLDAPADPVAAAEAFAAVLEQRSVAPAPGTSLGGDPVSASVRAGAPVDRSAVRATVGQLAALAARSGSSALVVDGTAVHDRGASDAQELGYSLAAGATYLRLLTDGGTDVATAARLLEFRYAATDEQFLTIAKLRAARRLWHRVLELSGEPAAGGQVQHAVTSRPMMTKYDPWVNLLRCTVAAFAAGVGGASSVTVLPFDSAIGLADPFSRRIARNTSALLVAESQVARVTDPAGGAFAVERLTDDLARAGWRELQRIEADGGLLPSLAGPGGGFLDRVRTESAEPRLRAIATRDRPVTGVSEFPHLGERLPERRPFPTGVPRVERYGSPFERMRDEPAVVPVFLATMGTLAEHTTRATEAANLFAAGGVDTVPAGATAGPDEVLASYAGQPVVCLAGTDAAYESWGAGLVTRLRGAGARYVVATAAPGDVLAVDAGLTRGMDAVAFLRRIREELAR